MMRSNSKQPFWLTGDMMSTLALAVLMLGSRGAAMGFAGGWWLSRVAAMVAMGVTFSGDGEAGRMREGKGGVGAGRGASG